MGSMHSYKTTLEFVHRSPDKPIDGNQMKELVRRAYVENKVILIVSRHLSQKEQEPWLSKEMGVYLVP